MSTRNFFGEGNIPPALRQTIREFWPTERRARAGCCRLTRLLRNRLPMRMAISKDRGGFWAPVELWHRDAEHWSIAVPEKACACWSQAQRARRVGDADEKSGVTSRSKRAGKKKKFLGANPAVSRRGCKTLGGAKGQTWSNPTTSAAAQACCERDGQPSALTNAPAPNCTRYNQWL